MEAGGVISKFLRLWGLRLKPSCKNFHIFAKLLLFLCNFSRIRLNFVNILKILVRKCEKSEIFGGVTGINVTIALAISGFVLMPAKTVISFRCTNQPKLSKKRHSFDFHSSKYPFYIFFSRQVDVNKSDISNEF